MHITSFDLQLLTPTKQLLSFTLLVFGLCVLALETVKRIHNTKSKNEKKKTNNADISFKKGLNDNKNVKISRRFKRLTYKWKVFWLLNAAFNYFECLTVKGVNKGFCMEFILRTLIRLNRYCGTERNKWFVHFILYLIKLQKDTNLKAKVWKRLWTSLTIEEKSFDFITRYRRQWGWKPNNWRHFLGNTFITITIIINVI